MHRPANLALDFGMMAIFKFWIFGSSPPTFDSHSGGVMDPEIGFHIHHWYSSASMEMIFRSHTTLLFSPK